MVLFIIPTKYNGMEFSRDANLGISDGTLILGVVGGGALQGKLRGNALIDVKTRGDGQSWIFGDFNYFSEGIRKLMTHVVAESPYYAQDRTIFGASYYEIYASHNGGKTWNVVYTLPFPAPRFSGAVNEKKRIFPRTK